VRKWVLTLAFAAMALPSFCHAQSNDLKQLLSGSKYPLTMKLKDLNGDWRRMNVSGQSDSSMGGIMSAMMSMFGGGGGGSAGGAFYTSGDMTSINNDTYIVAYKVRAKPVDMAALMAPNAKPPTPEKLTPETVLSLCLLNLRTSGNLTDIRPFNLNEEIAENANPQKGILDAVFSDTKTKAVETSSLSNLKQVAIALIMYVSDWDDVLPPMADPAKVKKVLYPYIKNEAVFVQPDTKEPYRSNPILSKKKLAHIGSPNSMVVFYEASPSADGTRGVAFLDGHAKRIPESQWAEVKRASKIP
jgi:hypothetical protein